MCDVTVSKGALFHGAERRRTRGSFDAELRTLTTRVAADASHQLYAAAGGDAGAARRPTDTGGPALIATEVDSLR